MKVTIFVLCIVSVAYASPAGWRIIGGQDAADGQFPYMVSLNIKGSHSCGGSIIDETTILCAAHCVSGQDSNTMIIRVGNNKLDQQTEEYAVKRYVAHEEYNPFTVSNDIAIIKVRTPIEFHVGVQPIALRQTNIADDVGEDVTLSGWGTVSYPSIKYPNQLQFVKLKTISVNQCKASHPGRAVSEKQVCTLTEKGEGACHADSGGPLVDAIGELVGIVSWGRPCARGYPDVFTRIYSYLDWIDQNRH